MRTVLSRLGRRPTKNVGVTYPYPLKDRSNRPYVFSSSDTYRRFLDNIIAHCASKGALCSLADGDEEPLVDISVYRNFGIEMFKLDVDTLMELAEQGRMDDVRAILDTTITMLPEGATTEDWQRLFGQGYPVGNGVAAGGSQATWAGSFGGTGGSGGAMGASGSAGGMIGGLTQVSAGCSALYGVTGQAQSPWLPTHILAGQLYQSNVEYQKLNPKHDEKLWDSLKKVFGI